MASVLKLKVKIPYFANDLELFVFFVVAGEKESSVFASSLPRPVEATHNHQVQSVPHSLQIVLLQLGRGREREGERGREGGREGERERRREGGREGEGVGCQQFSD